MSCLIKTEYSKDFHFLHIDQLWVFVFVLICCRRKLLWWQLNKRPIYEHRRTLLGVVLSPYSVSSTEVFGFPLGPFASLFLGSWPPTHPVGLNSNQIAVATPTPFVCFYTNQNKPAIRALGRWQQENQDFKAILHQVGRSQPPGAT